PLNLVGLSIEKVIAELSSPNLTRRMLAMNHLVDNVGRAALEPARRALATSGDVNTIVCSLWTLHRLNALDARSLGAAAKHDNHQVRAHTMRVLSEMASWNEEHRRLALAGLADNNAHVQRAAADALARQPSAEQVTPLLRTSQRVPKSDNHLLHTVRMALRNQLQVEGAFAKLQNPPVTENDSRAVADVAVAVASEAAGAFLLRHVERFSEPPETAGKYLRHVAKHLPVDGADRLVQLARSKFAADVNGQLVMFRSVQEGMAQRGASLSQPSRAWGEELASKLLEATNDASEWHNTHTPGMKETKSPWFTQKRSSADGNKNARFLCSLPPGGEHLTGVLRSKAFTVPNQLVFYIAGHDGPPDQPPQGKNIVRLREADSEAVLAEQMPPRNDTAQKAEWDLAAHAGKRAFIEVVDGDTGSGYAWLAIGRFAPAVVTIPKIDPAEIARRQQAGAEIARTLQFKNLQPELVELVASSDPETQAAAARAIAALHSNDDLAALAGLFVEPSLPAATRERMANSFRRPGESQAHRQIVTDVMRTSARRVQVKCAQGLASTIQGSETLLGLVRQRIAPAALLQERSVREKVVASNPSFETQVVDLTRGLAAPNQAAEKLLEQRRKGFDHAKARPTEGAALYTKNCAVCHQLDGQGGLVGPQLDGIGSRGLERLCEDVLDPNRSVDHAFRSTLLILKDGDVISGLLRREEGEIIVLADSTGKEIAVPKQQVAERRETDTSLMPDNFGELLSEQEFSDLMAYLLSKSASAASRAAK
ncbi:MAG: c-type cytochrome, partial [Verrucomicrobia subdivision 3 bacterium]|nr:c-type cytochrome [Limisphaerales bacterium]